MSMWNKRETHKKFFEDLANEHRIGSSAEWYKLRRKDVYDRGGQKLLQQYYEDSLCKVTLVM